MISGGKGHRTGTFSSHTRTSGSETCFVTHMPEDSWKIRIAFVENGETRGPVIKLDNRAAEMLWACLNSMAIDLKWEDFK